MIQSQRIIFIDNGTNVDLSTSLNEFRSSTATMAYVADEDYLYIASDYPFNHKFIDVSSVNAEAAAVSVDIWYNNAWVAAVDVIDRTADGGVSLAQSGIVQWMTDRDKGWEREDDSEDVDGVTLVGIYNKYWLRLKWSSDLTNTTALNFIGNKFSDDDKLESWYPDLKNDRLKTAFETGKTNWNEQHFVAAQQLIADLAEKAIIRSSGQILNYEKFEVASIHKVAEIIYMGLGKAYDKNRKTARGNYKDALNMQFFDVDKDRDARLSDDEKSQSQRYFSR